METLHVAGFDVRVTRRKNMRSIRLHVKPDGTVGISAPPGAPTSALEEIVAERAEWIERRRAGFAGSRAAQAETATEEEQREWRVLVEAAAPLLVEKWEPVMGVRVKKLVYRNMRSRWGSCQPATGRVCLNTRLALYPPRCLEYVVVHELTHLLEPSHNKRFHALLDSFLPDWRDCEQELRG